VLSWGAKRSLAVLLVPLVVACGGQDGPTVGGGEPGPDGEGVGPSDDSATAPDDGGAIQKGDASGTAVEDAGTLDAAVDALSSSDAPADGAAPDDASIVDATIIDASVDAAPEAGTPIEDASRDATDVDATAHDASVADAGAVDASAVDAGTVDATAHDASDFDAASDAGTPVEDASRDATVVDASERDATLDAAEESSTPEESGAVAGPGWSIGDAGLAMQLLSDGGELADSGEPEVTCIDLATQDLALDSTRGLLYVSVAGSSSVYGNSVVRIDPASVTVTGSVFVGSNPNALAVTDDATTLYVGIDGAFSVVAVGLASGDVGTPVYLGASTSDGARTAREIRAVPGSATDYVVSRKTSETDPSFAGLALYDGPTLLGEWNGATGGESIAFTSTSVLYGYNNETSGFDLYEFMVGPSGFDVAGDTMGLIQGYGAEIESQGGWIFATTGQAVNGTTAQPVGEYDATGPVWPDPNGTDVWYLDGSATALVLDDFNRTQFTLKRSFELPDSLVGPGLGSLVAWSSTGLAFRTPTAVCVVTVPPG
jgi:hypothetical protein